MGRKNRSKSAGSSVELVPEVASTVETRVKQGNEALVAKKFGEALSAYDDALKALPERHSMMAELHGSKAAVYLSDKKFKEAIKECNQGLSVEGSNAKVLNCRARARFESGLFKDALADIVKVNASSEKSDDSTAFEAKVRTAISGKANGTGGNGTISEPSAAAKPQQYTKEQTSALLKQSPSQFVCKVTLESETKYVHVPYGITYHALQQVIKSKWTGLHNFKISYQDKDQDWVLITSAKDVNKAQQEILAYAQRLVNQRQRQGLDSQLEKCKRGEVPVPPRDELPKGEEKNKVVVKSTDPHAEETVVELDEWLIDFANLFRDQLGIDPDRHVDMHTEGAEKCSKALDTVVQLPEAQELFHESFDRFRDVTCIGLSNWANVHLCMAKKLMEHAAQNGKSIEDVEAEFQEHCESSIQRYKEALAYNPNYVEALLGIGQVYIEQARTEAGILMPPLDNIDSDMYKELNQEELEEVTKGHGRDANAKLRVALQKVKAADVKKTAATWGKVYEQFGKAQKAAVGTKSPKTQEREESRADLVVSPPNQDETHLMNNQVQIIWGNALYDQSQIWAGVGLDGWKDMVDDAKARFIGATCKESDVNDALRNHVQADDLDLPAEEKLVPPPAPPVAEKKPVVEKKEGAKGLPALKKKKSGK